jgi:hypothetical protein
VSQSLPPPPNHRDDMEHCRFAPLQIRRLRLRCTYTEQWPHFELPAGHPSHKSAAAHLFQLLHATDWYRNNGGGSRRLWTASRRYTVTRIPSLDLSSHFYSCSLQTSRKQTPLYSISLNRYVYSQWISAPPAHAFEAHNAPLQEKNRQKHFINLIPSENFTSQAVLDALGSVMQSMFNQNIAGGKRSYMTAQTSTRRAILEHDTTEAMSSLIRPKLCVNKEPSRRLV